MMYPGGVAPEVRIMLDDPAWAPTSTFGWLLTARHQYDTFQTLKQWGYWPDSATERSSPAEDIAIERDARLVATVRRWSGQPLAPPLSGRFVPGDVAAMRMAVQRNEIGRRARKRLTRLGAGQKFGMSDQVAMAIDGIALSWLYRVVPYFVDLQTLVGLVDCEIPTQADLDDMVMPASDIAVFFGGDVAVPLELTEADVSLQEFTRRHDDAYADHPDWLSADDAPPATFTNPQMAIRHRRPVRVCGVVLHADSAGRLDDLVMWLTAVPDHVEAPRSIIYGWLSRSTLRYVAVNLAAAVAWGQWTSPAFDIDLGVDPAQRQFRDSVKQGRFRRTEPFGGAVGVKVLDAKRTIRRPVADGDDTHASPVTHLRRRHWQRYRVGPRDEWHYERRLLDPIVVNPGNSKPTQPLTIFRLPLP